VRRICLDYGHGGDDSGASVTDDWGLIQEKNIVLEIGKMVESFLIHDRKNYTVTRNGDYFLSLEDRIKIANGEKKDANGIKKKADCFISIHVDFFASQRAHGSTIFHFPGSRGGQELAEKIDNRFSARKIKRRGIKVSDDFIDNDDEKYIKVVAETKPPAVLIETGFISNDGDRRILRTHAGIYQTAWCIYEGLMDYYGAEN